MSCRQDLLGYAESTPFDVVIIGGGINGACAYDSLCAAGYKTLLVDKGDFAGATSQASGMMVWGGLLYLKNLDLKTVYKFSQARDMMIKTMDEQVVPSSYRYMPSIHGRFNKFFALLGLYLYWMLGHFRRCPPTTEKDFDEKVLLKQGLFKDSLLYEESMLRQSDSRFVLQWIVNHQSENHIPLNYCELRDGKYDATRKVWHLNFQDQLSSQPFKAKAKVVINCAGVWTDTINDNFNITTPYQHLFSKGVYISTKRPEQHKSPLVFEMGKEGDTLTYVPWGPVSLWGPTEAFTDHFKQGFDTEPDDIRFLLQHINHNLKKKIDKSDIVSIRCGVRPLAVKKSRQKAGYPLDISRRVRIAITKNKNWVSVYGGKITGCTQVASQLTRKIKKLLPPSVDCHRGLGMQVPKTSRFPGVSEPFPSIKWCMEHECCHTLGDYLRRRTNISQWVPREGLGESNENMTYLKELTMQLKHGNAKEADQELKRYRESVEERFDRLMEKV